MHGRPEDTSVLFPKTATKPRRMREASEIIVMNKSSSLLAFAILAAAVAIIPSAASAEQPQNPGAARTPIIASPGPMTLATIPLGCSGSGSSDVASRKHSITNTAGHTIPKGTHVSWTASNQGSGKLTLTSDLAPNGTVDVIEPGQTNGYTCTASFVPPNADLIVKSVAWTSATSANVVVANLSPWRDAGASTLRIERMKCLSSQLSNHAAPTPAISKGGSVTLTLAVPKADADYLLATANATNTVAESNTANNTNKSLDFSSNKSCTPQ